MKKYVYYLGEGDKSMKNILGGKGSGLNEMKKLGIPVPPAFTISTEVCKYYNENDFEFPKELKKQVETNLKKIEKELNKKHYYYQLDLEQLFLCLE
jgi:pyruvate,orthophosphate dikinase